VRYGQQSLLQIWRRSFKRKVKHIGWSVSRGTHPSTIEWLCCWQDCLQGSLVLCVLWKACSFHSTHKTNEEVVVSLAGNEMF